MNLRFIYVVKGDRWEGTLKEEWLYVYRMTKFYQWWLRKNFSLYYDVSADVLLVVKAPLMRLRFGMRDLMKYHEEKGKKNYHFYLSYFKPRLTDCSSGFFTDNIGLVLWKDFRGDEKERMKFLALENCTRVSHLLLHEVGRQKNYGREYKDIIHEQWDKHLYGGEDYEYYDKNFKKVSSDEDFMFATMRVPEAGAT